MIPGDIVVVDWRDAIPESGEPNKRRPAIIVGRTDIFPKDFAFITVVPLTADLKMVIGSFTLEIAPTAENRCTKPCFALGWNVQTIPTRRAQQTEACITSAQLDMIRNQIARLFDR